MEVWAPLTWYRLFFPSASTCSPLLLVPHLPFRLDCSFSSSVQSAPLSQLWPGQHLCPLVPVGGCSTLAGLRDQEVDCRCSIVNIQAYLLQSVTVKPDVVSGPQLRVICVPFTSPAFSGSHASLPFSPRSGLSCLLKLQGPCPVLSARSTLPARDHSLAPAPLLRTHPGLGRPA